MKKFIFIIMLVASNRWGFAMPQYDPINTKASDDKPLLKKVPHCKTGAYSSVFDNLKAHKHRQDCQDSIRILSAVLINTDTGAGYTRCRVSNSYRKSTYTDIDIIMEDKSKITPQEYLKRLKKVQEPSFIAYELFMEPLINIYYSNNFNGLLANFFKNESRKAGEFLNGIIAFDDTNVFKIYNGNKTSSISRENLRTISNDIVMTDSLFDKWLNSKWYRNFKGTNSLLEETLYRVLKELHIKHVKELFDRFERIECIKAIIKWGEPDYFKEYGINKVGIIHFNDILQMVKPMCDLDTIYLSKWWVREWYKNFKESDSLLEDVLYRLLKVLQIAYDDITKIRLTEDDLITKALLAQGSFGKLYNEVKRKIEYKLLGITYSIFSYDYQGIRHSDILYECNGKMIDQLFIEEEVENRIRRYRWY